MSICLCTAEQDDASQNQKLPELFSLVADAEHGRNHLVGKKNFFICHVHNSPVHNLSLVWQSNRKPERWMTEGYLHYLPRCSSDMAPLLSISQSSSLGLRVHINRQRKARNWQW